MQFILDNYLLIIIVGLFFAFALIGYLVELLKKDNNKDNSEIPSDLNTILMNKEVIQQKKDENVNEMQNDKTNQLLENYDNNSFDNKI